MVNKIGGKTLGVAPKRPPYDQQHLLLGPPLNRLSMHNRPKQNTHPHTSLLYLQRILITKGGAAFGKIKITSPRIAFLGQRPIKPVVEMKKVRPELSTSLVLDLGVGFRKVDGFRGGIARLVLCSVFG
jgi:hypothetical protein